MNDLAKEKEKSLTELMVRILKEPLKPLDKSMADLNGDLLEIKEVIEEANGMLSLCMDNAEIAAKQSKQAVLSLRSLREEQPVWLPSLQANIAEYVRVGVQTVEDQLGAHADRSQSALKAVTEDMRSALADISQGQISTAQAIGALQEHLNHELGMTNEHMAFMSQVLQEQIRHGQAKLDNAFALVEAQWASGFKDTTDQIGQLVACQQHAAQTMHQAMLEEMKSAAEQTQSTVAESLLAVNASCESLNNNHADLMTALNENAELLNSRLDQSLTKIRYLTITTGVFFVSMLAYVGYDLLSKLN